MIVKTERFEAGNWVEVSRDQLQHNDRIRETTYTRSVITRYWQIATPSKEVTPGEMLELLGPDLYGEILEAAQPPGNSQNPRDRTAAFFLKLAENPPRRSGLIDLTDEKVTQAMDYFVSKGWATETDKQRVLAGVIEV